MAKVPTVKRYKASVEGLYAGKWYEAEVVTYGKTKKETEEKLRELVARDRPTGGATWLYQGYYKTKPDVGIPTRLSITPMERVEQKWIATRSEYVESYTRIVRGKEQQVRGYYREYGYYVIPEDEEEITPEEEAVGPTIGGRRPTRIRNARMV